MNYSFIGTFETNETIVMQDKVTLNNWANYLISTEQAIKAIVTNNGMDDMTEEEFVEMAKSLGYER